MNHTYHSTTVPSAVSCGRDCSMDKQCASFNYAQSSRVCDLNNTTRVQQPDDLIQLEGYTYFDKNDKTPLLFVPVTKRYESCQVLVKAGFHDNGIYSIYPPGINGGLQVYCDMETDGGGWIVFQRRQDGSIDFYRNWTEYQVGFGHPSGEFWLGNEALRILTGSGKWKLRVELEDWEENWAWAEYDEFAISGESYTLHVGSYNATSSRLAKDSLTLHNGRRFITKDSVIQGTNGCRCARGFHGAWWFKCCHTSHLNGKYYHHSSVGNGKGIQWTTWRGYLYSLKQCSMKIRKVMA